MAKMNIQIDMSEYLDEAFEEGFQEGFIEGRQKGASEASVRLLDTLIETFDGYKKKGRDCISVDDAKMELCLAVGRMFKKKSEKHVDDPMDDDLK